MRRLLLALSAAALASSASAQDGPRGSTTAADHNFARAGFPRTVARWAQPSRTPEKGPGYVGGSVALGGDGPVGPIEGVFGYDCVVVRPDRVFLGWSHSPAGPPPGPYVTTGPRVFDVFSVRPVRRALAYGEGGEGMSGGTGSYLQR